jgi:hypothetical protein
VLHKAAAAKNMSVAQVLAVLGGEKRSDERVRMRATIKKVRRIIATTMATRKLERERRLGRRSSEVRCSPQPVLKASSSGRRVSLETDQMAKRKIGERLRVGVGGWWWYITGSTEACERRAPV